MSTFNTTNIESVSGGAVDFSNGLIVGGVDVTTLATFTEFYSQASMPTEAGFGAAWWDGTDLRQNVAGLWKVLSLTPPPVFYGDTGVFLGANISGSVTNEMDYITISTTGNASDFGDLTEAGYTPQGASDGSRGVIGGNGDGTSNTISYITFATPGNAIDFGDLTLNRYSLGAVSNGERGVFAGGFRSIYGRQNVIDYITIATLGNASDFGDLLATGSSVQGCSSLVYGLFAFQYPENNVIQYITIATLGNAQDFGDLLNSTTTGGASCSDGSYGLFAGGYDYGLTSRTTVIQYVTMNTPSNASDFGDLTFARNGMAGTSNGTRGVFGGGTDGSNSINIIDYVTIATPGNASDFGDLTSAKSLQGAVSGD